MATANLEVVEVKKMVEVVEKEEVFVLKLNRQEANFLMDVFGRIGGCPHKSRRKHADSIRRALAKLGAKNEYLADVEVGHGNTIYYKG